MAKELKKEHRKTALTRLEEWWLRDNNGDVKRVWYANSIEKTGGIKDGKVPGKNGFIQRSDKNEEAIEREVLDAFYKYGSADTEIRISHRNTEMHVTNNNTQPPHKRKRPYTGGIDEDDAEKHHT